MKSKKRLRKTLPNPRPWQVLVAGHGDYLAQAAADRIACGTSRIEERFARLVDRLGQLYARIVLRTWPVVFTGLESLVRVLRSVEDGDRWILAFRHPGDGDPHLVYYALNCLLRRPLRLAGLKDRVFPRFLAGADLVLWRDALVEWALVNSASIPVRHGACEAGLMRRLLDLAVADGRPLALAPEGQISYQCQAKAQMDGGIAWIAASLQDRLPEGRKCRILPLHLQYSYPRVGWKTLGTFISDLEELCLGKSPGAPGPGDRHPRQDQPGTLASRLLAVWTWLVEYGERLYPGPDPGWGEEQSPGVGMNLGRRCRALAQRALDRARHLSGLETGPGDLRQGIMELRVKLMESIIRQKPGSLLEEAVGNCQAAESFWIERHLERADLLEYLDESYLAGSPGWLASPEGKTRLVETAKNLHDLAMRLAGGTVRNRSRAFRARLEIRAGQGVNVADLASATGRRQRLSMIMAALGEEFDTLAAGAFGPPAGTR